MHKKFVFLTFSALCIFIFAHTAYASDTRNTDLKILNGPALNSQNSWNVYEEAYQHGATVAVGNVTGDGVEEIVVGSGPDRTPTVKIYNADGVCYKEFRVYFPEFKQGIKVATGNISGDDHDEIIVGTGIGGGPQIQVYRSDGALLTSFFAYGEGFRGGVNVAAGDVTGDDYDEIIAAAGPSGGPHVRVFNESGQWIGIDYFPFSEDFAGGVSVASGDIDGGDKEEIIMGVQSNGEARVKVYKADDARTIAGEWLAFPNSFRGGVNVAAGDIDNDSFAEVYTSTFIGGGPQIRVFEGYGALLSDGVFAYESEFRGGVYLAAGNIDADSDTELVTVPGADIYDGRTDIYKYIDVSLNEQKLYAYQSGKLVNSFYISSGIDRYPTPEGEFAIWRKREKDRLSWEYGPDHPDNYDLPDVPWISSFSGAYTIHGTYWHHNFGHRMSHGCVNSPTPQAKWIYDWSNIGTPVFVHK